MVNQIYSLTDMNCTKLTGLGDLCGGKQDAVDLLPRGSSRFYELHLVVVYIN